MRHSNRTVMETYTGKWFDFSAMDPAEIDVRDIAHTLSLTCRFGGQIPYFYSVGQHVLLVAHLIEEHFKRPDLALAGLHHDSHEAYVGDVPTPLKNMFGAEYTDLVNRLDTVIAFALNLDLEKFDDPIVHEADRLALHIEAAELKVSKGVGPSWGTTEVCPEALTYRPWVRWNTPQTIEDGIMAKHVKLVRPAYSRTVEHHVV